MKLPPGLAAKCVALSPGAKVPKRKPRTVLTAAKSRWAVVLYPACRVVSESNGSHGHWRVKAARVKAQRAAVLAAWWSSPLSMTANDRHWHAVMPLVVVLTHVGPKMDDDNLRTAFKAARDEVARLIGIDDGDECVAWRYEQRRGEPGVEVRIGSRD